MGPFLLAGCVFLALSAAVIAQQAAPPLDNPNKVLVIFHSRGGATKLMAGKIAQWFSAPLLEIQTKDYPESVSGWWAANQDTWNEKPSRISPETVDLSAYKLIFLGSPIWWYRPSPPLWTFVAKNEFHGAKVALFNTFNTEFNQEEIGRFARLVESRGGVFAGHIWVRRGRQFWQIGDKQLLEQTGALLKERFPEFGK